MKQHHERMALPLLLWVAVVAGAAGGWWLRSAIAPGVPLVKVAAGGLHDHEQETQPVITSDPPPAVIRATGTGDDDLVEELRDRGLRLPLDNVDARSLEGQFAQRRDGGQRGHEAVDLLAPRGTPVRAVDRGTIAKLFVSKAGGNTIYQFDSSGRACYYYAHLDGYAAALHEGDEVKAGQIIGFVGTTGNAPANTPHLHFAIFELTAERQWWKGTPIDPFEIYEP